MSLKKKLNNLKRGGSFLSPTPLKSQESIRAWVDYVVQPKGFLKSDEMMWCVMMVKNPLTNKKFKVVGNTCSHSVGDYLEFCGEWKERQGKMEFHYAYAMRVDDDLVGATSMLAFLFGPKSAKRIMESYEENALEAIELFKDSPQTFKDDMRLVKGIGPKKIEKAYEKHKNSVNIQSLFYKFCKFGLSLNKASKLIHMWGNEAHKIIDNNVYSLINVDGFSFDTIDRIGLNYYNFDEEDGRRIEAYIIEVLRKNSAFSGDCFMYLEANNGLISEVQSKLLVSDSLIRERIIELLDNKKLRKAMNGNKVVIYLNHIYKAEKNVAQMISSATRKNRIIKEGKIDELITQYEQFKGFSLAEKQKEGIKTSSINQFSIISGPPGSGKTTLIDCICYIFKSHKKTMKIKLAALSGKAADRMKEATGLEASTIHRLLGYNPDIGWKYNEKNPIPDVDLLIIDEFSMTDIVLAERLLKAINIDTVVIFVGDKDQLPSVDCGQVLEDLIDVSYIPKTILEEIYRQSDGSTTLPRAMKFNFQNKVPDLTPAKDFEFIETSSDIIEIRETTLKLYKEKIKEWGIKNVCLLEPQNVGELGADILNMLLQNEINPKATNKNEIRVGYKKIIREGDRVIQLKNIAENNLFNGMVGTVLECIPSPQKNNSEDCFTVDYDGMEYTYKREEFDYVKLAYALTVHKTQGSEYKCVIMLLVEQHSFMIRKKLVYTGMTRNKNELFFIGEKKMIEHALLNKDIKRKTLLTHWLNEYKVI